MIGMTLIAGGFFCAGRRASEPVMRFLAALGWRLEEVCVQGRQQTPVQDIQKVTGLERGMNIFDVDLQGLFAKISSLPWVQSVVVERRLPSQVLIRLCEKEILAVWHVREKRYLVDQSGKTILQLNPDQYDVWKHLTVITGQDSGTFFVDFYRLIRESGLELPRQAVYLRSGRWDIYLKRGLCAKLPEDQTLQALSKLKSLLPTLGPKVTVVDLRFPGTVLLENRGEVPQSKILSKEKK